MNKKNRIILYYNLIFLLVLLIGVSSFFLAYFYNLIDKGFRNEELNVSENIRMNFSVKEKDKDVYTHNTDKYLLSSIENINTYFNYSLTFSDEVYGSYSYSVIGYEIIGNDEKIKREVYKSDLYRYEITGSVINLSSSFNIDNFSEILNNLKEYVSTNNIQESSKIVYVVNINYSLFNDKIGKSISDKINLNIEIPNQDITTITKTQDIIDKKVTYSSSKQHDNELYLVITLEFLGAIIMFILIILLIIKAINRENDVYQVTLERIMKKYKDKIVILKDIPDLTEMNVLFVDSFEDIVDASDNLNQVINYTEIIVNKASTFIVFNNQIAYVYKLTR